jgi:PAS domain S-box-containing protein
MSANKEHLSKTMRIDLIPDAPSEPVAEGGKRVIITPPQRRGRILRVRVREESPVSRYQELLQSLYDAAIITDLNGLIVDANVRACDFLLHARDEMRRLTIFEVVAGSDESLIKTLVENLEDERYTLIMAQCLRKDGSLFPAEIAVNKLQIGRMHLVFFIRDITLRRQAEEMLRTEHNAIQNADNAIAVANLDARLEYVNPSGERMWGCRASDELLGRDVRDLFKERALAEGMIGEVVNNQRGWTGELRAVRVDGVEFEVQASAARNRNADGELVGIVFSFVDISDRKRAEGAVREADRHRVMLESLGTACHHIGQPATILMGSLEIMQSKLANADPSVQQLVRTGLDSMRSLANILQKLQAVTEYRTRTYLDGQETAAGGESRILEI